MCIYIYIYTYTHMYTYIVIRCHVALQLRSDLGVVGEQPDAEGALVEERGASNYVILYYIIVYYSIV